MKDPYKRRYLYLMLSIFGAISLSIVVFFVVYRFQGIGDGLRRLSEIMAPFIYGGVVAYLLRPLCNRLESFFKKILPGNKQKLCNALSIGVSLLTGILIVYMVIIMIAPQLYRSITNFWMGLPQKFNRFLAWAQAKYGEDEELLSLAASIYNNAYNEITNWVSGSAIRDLFSGINAATSQGGIITYLSGFVGGVGNGLIKVVTFLYNLLIGLIIGCYLLSSRKKLAAQGELIVRSLLSPRHAELVLDEIAFIDRMFEGFIDGKLLDSAIIGVLCYIGCLIFRFPMPLLVSAIVGITNIIPFFGPFIGAVPATILIMLENPIKGLWFIVFVLGLQQLDGNVIGPKILGDKTGLSSFWVLFAIVLCGGLWGIGGMVVCVPLCAVFYNAVKRLVRRGLTKKEQGFHWDKYKADYPDE